MQRLENQQLSDFCPYCGSAITLFIDTSIEAATGTLHYEEDCEVCCRPISVYLSWLEDNTHEILLLQENDIR